jgi:hypothetical protein
MVFIQEIREVLSPYPEMPAGQSESQELSGTYPAQDGSITHAAPPGHKTYREIFRRPLLRYFIQLGLLLRVLRGPDLSG